MSRQTISIGLQLKYSTQTNTRTLKNVMRGKALDRGYYEQVVDFTAYTEEQYNAYKLIPGNYNSTFWVLIPTGDMDIELELDGVNDPIVMENVSTPCLMPFRIRSIRARMSSYSANGTLYVLRSDLDPTLQPLTVSGLQVGVNYPVGTVVATIVGAAPDSVLTVSDPRFAISGNQLVTATVFTLDEEVELDIVETNLYAANSPRTTSVTIAVENNTLRTYWGVSALETLTEAQILALSTKMTNTLEDTISYDCRGGRYPYYAAPSSFGLPSEVLVNSMLFTAYQVSQIELEVDGDTIEYNVFRFMFIQTGNPIEVQWRE